MGARDWIHTDYFGVVSRNDVTGGVNGYTRRISDTPGDELLGAGQRVYPDDGVGCDISHDDVAGGIYRYSHWSINPPIKGNEILDAGSRIHTYDATCACIAYIAYYDISSSIYGNSVGVHCTSSE